MTLSEKSELLRLLQLYQDDLLRKNRENIQTADAIAKDSLSFMDASYFYGIKAQYNHARLIARKLSVEIGKDVKSYWELSWFTNKKTVQAQPPTRFIPLL